MKKIIALAMLLMLTAGMLAGCGGMDARNNEETIPEYAAEIKGIEKYAVPVDYAQDDNWIIKQESGEKPVDVIYLYPTRYYVNGQEDDDLCEIHDKDMRKRAVKIAQKHTTVFEESCNIYAPFYRQLSVPCILDLVHSNPEALSYCASKDLSDVLDYYFTHCNDGKPFILAGHSQGSIMLCELLSDYMKEHPEHLENMVAAYVIGYSITEEYLAENPHLKFAEGADDTGVIVSYNTEGIGNHDEKNGVVKEGAVAINPINWKTDETYAPAADNPGSLVSAADGSLEIVEGLADARLDLERGVVICESVDPAVYASKSTNCFGPESYHSYDYGFYYMNLRENIAVRIAAFLQ